jgi:hypothetical protein
MKKRLAATMATAAVRLMALGATANIFALGVYFYKFAPGHWFELSSSQEVWALFGTFIGGVLGPYFSFLAFIGVILTVVLQARQLDIVRDQAEFEELQRVMSTSASRIDSLLSQRPNYVAAKEYLENSSPMTIFDHLAAFGTRALDPSAVPHFPQASWNDRLQAVMADIKPTVNAVGLELHQLAWCLRRYKEEGGGQSVLEFYAFRFGAMVSWLDSMGELSSDLVRSVFDLPTLKRAMAPQAPAHC